MHSNRGVVQSFLGIMQAHLGVAQFRLRATRPPPSVAGAALRVEQFAKEILVGKF